MSTYLPFSMALKNNDRKVRTLVMIICNILKLSIWISKVTHPFIIDNYDVLH